MSLRERVAVGITSAVGTLTCAGVFAFLALVSLPQAISTHNLVIIISWLSQTFLQLVLLSIIMVGQSVQSRQFEQHVETLLQAILAKENTIEGVLEDIEDDTSKCTS